MAGKEDSNDSDGPIIDDNVIRIQLRKPCQRKWELRTRNLSPGIKFPTIQLFDCDGNLLVETNDDNISIRSSDFDDRTLKATRSLKEKDFRHFIDKKSIKKHNTISGDKIYTRVYRTPVGSNDNRENGNKGYIISDGNTVANIPSKLTINNNFPNLRANSLDTTPFQSEGVSDISSYKSSDNETCEEHENIKQTLPNGIQNKTFYANGASSLKSSKNSSVSSLSEIDQSIEISLEDEKDAILGLHKSKSFNDTVLGDCTECAKDGVQRSKSGVVYRRPNNQVSFLNTYLKSLPARMISNPDWFALHRRPTIGSPRISLAPPEPQGLPKFPSEKSWRSCKIGDNTSDNEFINIPTDVAADCEMKKRLKMYRRGLSEIETKHRVLSVYTKKRSHSMSGSLRLVHTSSSESVDEADVVLNRLKRRILKNKMREKRRSLGEKFQFGKCH